MTPKTIHLNKLLKLMQLQDAALTSALRAELRAERDKLEKPKEGGGDFHAPFWFDAKLHVRNIADLKASTSARVESSKQRKRLYPLLASGFLSWLEGLKRSTNQHVGWKEVEAHNHHSFPTLDLTVKVDNLLALSLGQDHFRLVYPYFSETPVLSEKWARVGLWVMSEAFQSFSPTDMEIIDVLRGTSFAGSRVFFKGDEESLFSNRYEHLMFQWGGLRPEYNL